jgi:galactose-1-phosphate uridylyltransferase
MDTIPGFLLQNIENESIDELSLDQILASFLSDPALMESSRGIRSAIDPRNGEPVIFNPARSLRPHNYPSQAGPGQGICPICQGETTGILDWASLENGITFINKNLYPVLPPPRLADLKVRSHDGSPQGLHFVQWTSSVHDDDWYNLPIEDCLTVMGRLAALEKVLLDASSEIEIRKRQTGIVQEDSWYVSIIKNVGSAVGGSLEHGHQQVILGNIAPLRILRDQQFENNQGICFSKFLIEECRPELVVRKYGGAVLLVGEFMRRPYEMILAVTDPTKRYLHQLAPAELRVVTQGWKDASRAIRAIMPGLGRQVAFNVVAHNGPGCGLYFEFLPYTQEQGGLEHLGLAVCQARPEQAADHLRQILT